MTQSTPAASTSPRARLRWRRWLIGITPWVLLLIVVALLSPLRS